MAAGRPAALAYADLDEFKRVNDTLGHETADQLLREVAERLSATAGPAISWPGSAAMRSCCCHRAGGALDRAGAEAVGQLHFQPIHRRPEARVMGVEALVRWRRDGMLVPPLEFIGVAERTGVIDRRRLPAGAGLPPRPARAGGAPGRLPGRGRGRRAAPRRGLI